MCACARVCMFFCVGVCVCVCVVTLAVTSARCCGLPHPLVPVEPCCVMLCPVGCVSVVVVWGSTTRIGKDYAGAREQRTSGGYHGVSASVQREKAIAYGWVCACVSVRVCATAPPGSAADSKGVAQRDGHQHPVLARHLQVRAPRVGTVTHCILFFIVHK